jgi:hypothetical protein
MRRFRVPEIVLGFLIATAVWAVLVALNSDPAAYDQICHTNEYTGHEECAPHHIPYVVAWYVGEFLNYIAAALTAIATFAIARFTFTLKRSTDNLWAATKGLVSGADDIARRDLRAYVLLEDTFFVYKGEIRTYGPNREFTDDHKIRIKNFGRTPAFDMSIWLHRASKEIPDKEIDGFLEKTHSEQPLAPGHRYGPNFPIEYPFRHTDDFFFYGKMVYRDIYERWWVTRFGWQYQQKERFSPHGTHNREDGPFTSKPS